MQRHTLVADVGSDGARFGFGGGEFFSPSLILQHSEKNCAPPFTFSDIDRLQLDECGFLNCLSGGIRELAQSFNRPVDDFTLESGLAVVEPTQADAAMNQAMVEVLFEDLKLPKVFFFRRAPMIVAAHGLKGLRRERKKQAMSGALVVDAGASHLCCSVVRGMSIMKTRVLDCAIGGSLLAQSLQKKLNEGKQESSLPKDMLKLWSQNTLMEELIGLRNEKACPPIVLPDGSHVNLNHDLCHQTVNLFFTDPQAELGELQVQRPFCRGDGSLSCSSTFSGLQNIMDLCIETAKDQERPTNETLNKAPADFRNDLADHVVLAGGCSKLYGFSKKFEPITLFGRKVRCHGGCETLATTHSSAVLSEPAWTGGAICASIAAIESRWITKQMYDELGMRTVNESLF